MALQNADRTEDEKDRAEIIFKIARSRKGIKKWTGAYIDQGVCEKRSDQLNRRVKRITSKMMNVRKAHPTNPERIKVGDHTGRVQKYSASFYRDGLGEFAFFLS